MLSGETAKYKIDKGVPIPDRIQRIPLRTSPLHTMEVGDSYFKQMPPGGKSAGVTGMFSKFKPKKFTIRTVVENGIRGVRIWRIE